MRHVFNNDEIPHLWANQTQSEARNSGGTLYFRDSTIYSYRDSFPIATIHKNKKGETLVLFNSARYGNTTGKHQSAARQAVSQFEAIEVPFCRSAYAREFNMLEHQANLDHLADKSASLLKKAQRALRSYSVTYPREQAETLARQSALYIRFFKLKAKPIVFDAAAWDAAQARVTRIENPDPNSADKRQRDAAKRQERKALQESLAVECWRTNWRLAGAFGAIQLARHRHHGWNNLGAVMLRLDDDEIVTSMGARIPASHAPVVWKAVQRCIDTGAAWEKNGHTIHAGAYSIDRIEPDGTMTAGCHTIPHAELRVMARALGLA